MGPPSCPTSSGPQPLSLYRALLGVEWVAWSAVHDRIAAWHAALGALARRARVVVRQQRAHLAVRMELKDDHGARVVGRVEERLVQRIRIEQKAATRLARHARNFVARAHVRIGISREQLPRLAVRVIVEVVRAHRHLRRVIPLVHVLDENKELQPPPAPIVMPLACWELARKDRRVTDQMVAEIGRDRP